MDAEQRLVAPAQLALPVTVTETSWTPQRELTFEQWAEAGRGLQRIGRAWRWWLGDWIRYGERRWGERYDAAIDLTGLEYGTLANVVYVANHVEFSRRRENLPWSLHHEVAPLPPDEQQAWLDRAEAEGMTRERLRRALTDERREREGRLARLGPAQGALTVEPHADETEHIATLTVRYRGDVLGNIDAAIWAVKGVEAVETAEVVE